MTTRRKIWAVVTAGVLGLILAGAADAAYLLEIDTDGADDGVLTYHPNFSFGGDTTSASQSISSLAVGMTGGDSIFGGNGAALPDTYVYNYTPSVDGSNLLLPAGTALNDDGDQASGIAAGGSGDYRIYATWPWTSSVSGGDTRYTLNDNLGELFSVLIDQNGGVAGAGHEWAYLGTATLDAGLTYTLTQQPSVQNSYVSMRAAGILFDPVPEPATLLLLSAGGLGLIRRRRG